MGDAVNVSSRLASLAQAGELLISEVAHEASGLDLTHLPVRSLQLKGRQTPIDVRVWHVRPDETRAVEPNG
jgi:adenylate cyclase